jgi:hypothetical protein
MRVHDRSEVDVMEWMKRDGASPLGELVKRWSKMFVLAVLLLAAAPSAWATVYVRIQPPDMRFETHENRSGYIWQSGYWRWHGKRHQWKAGHYARQKSGRHWTDGRWESSERGYYWVGGRWER